jgi:protocatechuate 3,4-dioxygenase beta subunit
VQLPERITRRRLLGLAALGLAGVPLLRSRVASADAAVACVLTPELTEGPYYLPNEPIRRNITEGKPGMPLRLHLTVAGASSCRAIKGAAVDIWHADAGGVYSGVAGNTGTFLRGIQLTDRNGLAVFDTIYPGWYRGRAVHIHVKVHVGGNVVHTGQLFFPDALSDRVYKTTPYRARGNPDTTNAEDAIYRSGGSRSLLRPVSSGSGYVASMMMGVRTG